MESAAVAEKNALNNQRRLLDHSVRLTQVNRKNINTNVHQRHKLIIFSFRKHKLWILSLVPCKAKHTTVCQQGQILIIEGARPTT